MVERLQVKTASLRAGITSLSGGNQQKCILGRWLLTEPVLLLLDDPTRGIDVGAKAELYRLIRSLCREGLSIILTSSEMRSFLPCAIGFWFLVKGGRPHFSIARKRPRKRFLKPPPVRFVEICGLALIDRGDSGGNALSPRRA